MLHLVDNNFLSFSKLLSLAPGNDFLSENGRFCNIRLH